MTAGLALLPAGADSFHRRIECEKEALASGSCSSVCEALIEELAVDGEPLPSLLQLVCLSSQVGNGLRPKAHAAIVAELVAAYGYGKQ